MENIVGQIGFVIGTSFMYSAPLIFTALGGVVTENSGVVNIGLEGMMVVGAFAGAAVRHITPAIRGSASSAPAWPDRCSPCFTR
jgi:simple sugar transport system permease protein